MAKKATYSFTEKRNAKGGVIATGLGVLSLLAFLILAGVAYAFKGQGGIYLGTIGLTAMIISICGLIIGLVSFGEEDKTYFYSKLGSVLSGLIMVGWISVILIGI